MTWEECRQRLTRLKERIDEFSELLNIDTKKEKLYQLQLKMGEPAFWNDSKASSSLIDELKALKDDVDKFQELDERFKALQDLLELQDSSYEKDVLTELGYLEEEVDKFKLTILFQGKFDNSNAIVEINSGAGGTEACDWASMLFRMYARWAQDKGFPVKTLDEVRGEEAGIKNVTLLVEGKNAYGLLKTEKGVHRLVRISPFDANRRRHTSFASVNVLPEVKDASDLQIKQEELKIETFRASGAGGQHVNRTDSAVRMIHLPTGIVVTCQNERSQYQNKQTALKILKAKLYQLREEEKKKEMDVLAGNKRKIEWGSQIRSYILHPYLLVKDHRTGLEVTQAKGVLDGKIDEFIYQYLWKSLEDDQKSSS